MILNRTHYFASEKTRNALSFLVGYSNTLGLVGGLCSIDYGFALMFCSVYVPLPLPLSPIAHLSPSIVISRDGEWEPTNGIVYSVFLACVLLHGVLASTLSKIMGKLQTVFVVMNLILIAATIIALPVGKRLGSERNDAHYIFAKTENLTTWPTGWAFMLSWLSPIWVRFPKHFLSITNQSRQSEHSIHASICQKKQQTQQKPYPTES